MLDRVGASLWHRLSELVLSDPDRTLIRFTDTQTTVEYSTSTFANIVRQIAGELDRNDPQPGGQVGVALSNRVEFPATLFACSMLGLRMVPLNLRQTAEYRRWVIDTYDVSIVLTETQHLPEYTTDQMPAIAIVNADEMTVDGTGQSLKSLEAPPSSDHLVSLGFTSGSSGTPKAVGRTERQWRKIGQMLSRQMSLSHSDALHSAQAFYYGDPFYVLMACMETPCIATFSRQFDASNYWNELERVGATKALMIGVMPRMLTEAGIPTDVGDLQAIWSVGVPSELHQMLENKTGLPWYEVYGLVETATVFIESLGSESHRAGSGNLGAPIDEVDVRLVDVATGASIEGDGEGLLEVRGPLVFAGYHLDEARDESDWFSTGDIMRRTNGQYIFVRRLKEVIRRAGENIPARLIEDACTGFSSVLEAAAVPIPDPVRGEEVGLFLRVEDLSDRNASWEIVASLDEHLSSELAKFQVPRYYAVTDAFPRTASEKTDKKVLREHMDRMHTFDRFSTSGTRAWSSS